jgi:phosphoglycerate dehydrogenase-like enzyme
VEALRDQKLAGAALDVYSQEPLPPDSPLRSAPNILLSPHQASFTRESGERVSLAAANAIVALLQHRVPENVLNPEVFHSSSLRWREG